MISPFLGVRSLGTTHLGALPRVEAGLHSHVEVLGEALLPDSGCCQNSLPWRFADGQLEATLMFQRLPTGPGHVTLHSRRLHGASKESLSIMYEQEGVIDRLVDRYMYW